MAHGKMRQGISPTDLLEVERLAAALKVSAGDIAYHFDEDSEEWCAHRLSDGVCWLRRDPRENVWREV